VEAQVLHRSSRVLFEQGFMPVSIEEWHGQQNLGDRLAKSDKREEGLCAEVAELRAVEAGRKASFELQNEMDTELDALTGRIALQVDRQYEAALGIGFRRLGLLLGRWRREACRALIGRWRTALEKGQSQKRETWWEHDRKILLASQEVELQQMLLAAERRATEGEEAHIAEKAHRRARGLTAIEQVFTGVRRVSARRLVQSWRQQASLAALRSDYEARLEASLASHVSSLKETRKNLGFDRMRRIAGRIRMGPWEAKRISVLVWAVRAKGGKCLSLDLSEKKEANEVSEEVSEDCSEGEAWLPGIISSPPLPPPPGIISGDLPHCYNDGTNPFDPWGELDPRLVVQEQSVPPREA